jgi:hypothetical protein
LLGLLSACRPTPAELAERAASALEAGALEDLEPMLHATYTDTLGGRAEALAGFRELFEIFPGRKLRFEALELQTGEALVLGGAQHVELNGQHSVKMVAPLQWELDRGLWSLEIRSGLLEDLRDIEALLASRRAAMEGNDAEAYGRLLHPEYRDGDLNREQALVRIAEDLSGVVIRFEPVHHQIEVRKDLAHVDERYTLRVGEQAFPRGLARLTLRTSLGRWRIAGGLYPP